jgi:hypothetical protein
MAFVKYTPTGERSVTGKPIYTAELVRGERPDGGRMSTGAEQAEPRPGERGFIPSGTTKGKSG